MNNYIFKISGYSIDFELVIQKILKNKYKRVLLQFPEGLKIHFEKIIDFLKEKTSCLYLISADPCFGACDIFFENKNFDIDLIIQIGHLPIPNIKNVQVPIIFVNAESTLDVNKIVNKAIPKLIGKKIGIITTAQHVHLLSFIGKILEKNNFKYLIGKGDNRLYSEGQVLGCNFSSANSIKNKVDSFLFIGSGNFHPLGLLLSTKKPVIACDPYTCEIRLDELELLKEEILRQRYGAIARSKDAKHFGIIIGTKLGQQRIKLAIELEEIIKIRQKKSYIFTANHFNPLNLESFRKIDCFVSTACPRIAIDDYMQYKIPILTPIELEILLGFKKWDEYKFDEIFA